MLTIHFQALCRYRLMDDPTAKECVRRLDAMMLEAGMSTDVALSSMKQLVDMMQQEIQVQEKLGSSYQALKT